MLKGTEKRTSQNQVFEASIAHWHQEAQLTQGYLLRREWWSVVSHVLQACTCAP